jgi:hypothetical protein
VIFERLDFLARLVALVLKPRVKLSRFHGVFAPNSKHRIQDAPSKRRKGSKRNVEESATRRPRPAKPLFQQIHHSLHSLDTDAQIPV